MKRLLLSLIALYQRLVSPLTGDCCRFEPSCSRYAVLCLEHHGALRGTWLTCRRLLRCNPLFGGGIDLPPGVDPCLAEPDWERVARLTNYHGQSDTCPDCAPNAPVREH